MLAISSTARLITMSVWRLTEVGGRPTEIVVMIRDGVQYTSPILVPRQRSNVLYGSMRSIQTFIAMPELGDGYEIHGPFPSMEALTFYAAGWDAYANDSGWQSVRLRDPRMQRQPSWRQRGICGSVIHMAATARRNTKAGQLQQLSRRIRSLAVLSRDAASAKRSHGIGSDALRQARGSAADRDGRRSGATRRYRKG
jgi:hypothetical protein